MKLRKILASTVATTACVAMLSTNVFAAIENNGTLQTVKDGDKVKVTITGTLNGTTPVTPEGTDQTTLLVVDNTVTDLTALDPDEIQYIDQDTYSVLSTTGKSFAKRESSSATIVDIYSGGEDVSTLRMLPGVYVKSALKYEGTAPTADAAGFNAAAAETVLLNNATEFQFADIGSTGFSPVTYNAEDFEVTKVDDNVVTVSYGGAETDVTFSLQSAVVIASVEIETGLVANTSWNTDDKETVENNAKTQFSDKTARVVYEDGADPAEENVSFADCDFDYDASTQKITVSYKTVPATNTIDVVFKTNSIVGVNAVNNVPVSIAGTPGTPMDADAVELWLSQQTAISGFAPQYVWAKDDVVEAIPVGEMIFEAVQQTDSDDATDTFNVTVKTSKTVDDAAAGETTIGSLIVTVTYQSFTGVKGVIRVADYTGAIDTAYNFGKAIPVGAVVTAIPVESGSGVSANVKETGVYETAKSVATMVGANGEFELNLPEGNYMVFISHTKFVLYEGLFGDVLPQFLALGEDGQGKLVEVSSDTPVHYIGTDVLPETLYYTHVGDLNLDGLKGAPDSTPFNSGFPKTSFPYAPNN